MSSKLYVGNLDFKTTEDELRGVFAAHGNVTEVFMAMDKFTGRPRGFAFVTMGSPEEAKAAIAAIHGTKVGSRELTVNEARPREERAPGGYSGGGQRGGYAGAGRGGYDRGGDRGGYGERRGGGNRY